MDIAVKNIRSPRIQFRPVLKETVEYHELLDSIKADGLLQPILVRPLGDAYEVVEGNWRFHACSDAGMETIPCLVREFTDSEVEVIQLKTQAIRPETSKADFAKRLRELMQRENYTIAQLGKLINKSTIWVRRMLSLSTLHHTIQKQVDRGEISLANATALARLPEAVREHFIPHAIMLSVVEFDEMVRRAVQDIRQCSQQDMTAWIEYRDTHYIAYLRQMKEVKAEAASNRSARRIIRLLEAKTPLDGWRACLSWLLHVDPDSLQDQKEDKLALARRKATLVERRKQNRTLIKELCNIEPEINHE